MRYKRYKIPGILVLLDKNLYLKNTTIEFLFPGSLCCFYYPLFLFLCSMIDRSTRSFSSAFHRKNRFNAPLMFQRFRASTLIPMVLNRISLKDFRVTPSPLSLSLSLSHPFSIHHLNNSIFFEQPVHCIEFKVDVVELF